MFQWQRLIKRILGYFWTDIWKDQWLIDLICKFFPYVSGQPLLSRMSQVQEQLSRQAAVSPDFRFPVRLLISAQSQQQAIIPLTQIVIGSASTTLIGGKTSQVIYMPFDVHSAPQSLQDKVDKPAIVLKAGNDYQMVDGYLRFNKSLGQLGFKKKVITVNQQLTQCYQLWGTYYSYKTLRDAFTGILQVPDSWLWKYPGAVDAAWSIKINGINKKDVLRLLGAVGNCPVSQVSGTVSDVTQNTVTIGNKTYTGSSYILVTKGQYVTQGQPLFAASAAKYDVPAVYTWKDQLPASVVPGLPVITDAGLLSALNRDNVGVIQNVLPLTGQTQAQYTQICQQRNNDTAVPYVQLPQTLNPAEYVMANVWRHSGFVVIAPSSNVQDMSIATRFIVDNAAVGSLPVVFRFGGQYTVLQPQIDADIQVLDYYNESINNNSWFKERYNDFNA